MRSRLVRILGFFSAALMITVAFAANAPATSEQRAAARLKVCPGQECTFGEWRARAEVPVYKSQDTSSEVVFKTAKGDSVTGISAELVVSKLGACMTTRPVQAYETGTKTPVALKARERISALYFSGDGYVVGNYGRRRVEACCVNDDLECKTEPASQLWLKVKSAAGVVGWSNQRDKFTGTTD